MHPIHTGYHGFLSYHNQVFHVFINVNIFHIPFEVQLGFFKVLHKAKMYWSRVVCNSCKNIIYELSFPSVPSSHKYVLILLCNCAYISCCALASTYKGSKITIACMGSQEVLNWCFCLFYTFRHAIIYLYFCNNKYCSSSDTLVLHEIILSLYTLISLFLCCSYFGVSSIYED